MAAVTQKSVGAGFAADEVAFVLRLPRRTAQSQVALAQDLIDRLPAVFASLDRGDICLARARVFSDELVAVADDDLARTIVDKLLPLAPEWTASQLRARLRREVLAADPNAAKERYERAVAERRVCLEANFDTTANLSAIFLPAGRAVAAFERVDALARGRKNDGDLRTLDQLRADVLLDLLDGTDIGAKPVGRRGVVELIVPLATLTEQTDQPAHLAGYGPVLADVARQVATQAADQAAAHAAGQAALREAVYQWRFSVYDDDGTLLHHGTTTARPDPIREALFGLDGADPTLSPLSLAWTPWNRTPIQVAPGVLRMPPRPEPCPPAADPKARLAHGGLRRWIAARDRTCRAPGCTAPARICDQDHTADFADGGTTTDDNLGLLCRHHHRLKHQGGFTLLQPRPGVFLWISNDLKIYDVGPEPPG
jgi:hypothetical protein